MIATTIRDTYATSRLCKAAGREFFRGRVMLPQPGHRPRMIWQCRHEHPDRDDAYYCADSIRNCDTGSLQAEELLAVIGRIEAGRQ